MALAKERESRRRGHRNQHIERDVAMYFFPCHCRTHRIPSPRRHCSWRTPSPSRKGEEEGSAVVLRRDSTITVDEGATVEGSVAVAMFEEVRWWWLVTVMLLPPLPSSLCSAVKQATIAERANAFRKQCQLAETVNLNEIEL
ncbi:hypothetical protein PIB30_077089 [Stylosanthes scabra]|uniref:Uncharacterized protein n=1 Tax=Stylosanthes scabra TaxID=79078 RepID=A0ABU6UPV8_9FABA|nr:hypothetical protein [Stylosanthes scabra]